MRALFLAPNEPWCRENGTNLIIADMLQALAGVEGAAVLPVFLGSGPRECLGPATVSAATLGVEPLPKWLSLVWAASTGRCPNESQVLPFTATVGRQEGRVRHDDPPLALHRSPSVAFLFPSPSARHVGYGPH